MRDKIKELKKEILVWKGKYEEQEEKTKKLEALNKDLESKLEKLKTPEEPILENSYEEDMADLR